MAQARVSTFTPRASNDANMTAAHMRCIAASYNDEGDAGLTGIAFEPVTDALGYSP